MGPDGQGGTVSADRSPTRFQVRDLGLPMKLNELIPIPESQPLRVTCTWVMYTSIVHNLPFLPLPCHEEWSMIITCYQVQIMRGEGP